MLQAQIRMKFLRTILSLFAIMVFAMSCTKSAWTNDLEVKEIRSEENISRDSATDFDISTTTNPSNRNGNHSDVDITDDEDDGITDDEDEDDSDSKSNKKH
ncbi:MAG: hypothetical protein RL092_602 [Bacteroidota bacterium]